MDLSSFTKTPAQKLVDYYMSAPIPKQANTAQVQASGGGLKPPTKPATQMAPAAPTVNPSWTKLTQDTTLYGKNGNSAFTMAGNSYDPSQWSTTAPGASSAPTSPVPGASNPLTSPTAPTGTPTAPNGANTADQQLEALRQAYIASLKPGADETQALADLNALKESYRTGAQNIQDKVMPMEFITGQQQSLENRANNQQQTLTDRLSALQATRNANAQAAQAALGYKQEDITNQQNTAKQNQTDIMSIAEAAAKNGAPADVISKIIKMATPQEALAGASTYMSPAGQNTVKNITIGSGKTAKDYIITYDSKGNELSRELLDANGNTVSKTMTGQSASGQSINFRPGLSETQKQGIMNMVNNKPRETWTAADTANYNYATTIPAAKASTGTGTAGKKETPTQQLNTMSSKVQTYFSGVIGGDSKVSPQDWGKAKQAWIADGGNATVFDTKFKGYKNPDNQYYQ